MKIEAHTMQIRVSDLAEAESWYGTLLGRTADFVPDDSVAEWELHANCWLAVVQARPDPGRNRIRLGVADLPGQAQRIRDELAVEVSEPTVLAGIVAYCDFSDPYGNRLGLFQDLRRYPWRGA